MAIKLSRDKSAHLHSVSCICNEPVRMHAETLTRHVRLYVLVAELREAGAGVLVGGGGVVQLAAQRRRHSGLRAGLQRRRRQRQLAHQLAAAPRQRLAQRLTTHIYRTVVPC